MALGDAPRLGGVGTVHLVAFVVPLFPEHREKHDAPRLSEEVSDAPRHRAEVESKLVQSVAQLPGVWHSERRTADQQSIDVEGHMSKLWSVQFIEPCGDSWFLLDVPVNT